MITHSCTLVYLYCYCSSGWLYMWFCSLKLMLHMKQVGQALLLFYIYIIIVILRGYHVALRVAISYMMLVSRIIAIAMIRLFYLFNACYYCLICSAVCMLCFSLTHFLSAFLASHSLFAWVSFIYFFSLTRFLSSFLAYSLVWVLFIDSFSLCVSFFCFSEAHTFYVVWMCLLLKLNKTLSGTGGK